MYVRSKLVSSGKPLCLIDHSPRHSGPRDVLAQPCIEALEMFDGREIWWIREHPTLTRWYGPAEGIRDVGVGFPVIDTYNGDSNNIVENLKGSTLYQPSKNMCIGINDVEFYKYSCDNLNVEARAEDARVAFGNDPCNPTKLEPKPFMWLPNTTQPEILFQFQIPYTNIKSIKIKFDHDPEEITVTCFNDL